MKNAVSCDVTPCDSFSEELSALAMATALAMGDAPKTRNCQASLKRKLSAGRVNDKGCDKRAPVGYSVMRFHSEVCTVGFKMTDELDSICNGVTVK
jgi:hypothetical protein